MITKCPSCNGSKLYLTKIECTDCHTLFSGQFDIPVLLKLSEEDIRFITDFVKCSGSLKEMGSLQQVSYPTLRNRLNGLIEALEQLESTSGYSKDDILQLVEDGKITAQEAADLLRKL